MSHNCSCPVCSAQGPRLPSILGTCEAPIDRRRELRQAIDQIRKDQAYLQYREKTLRAELQILDYQAAQLDRLFTVDRGPRVSLGGRV